MNPSGPQMIVGSRMLALGWVPQEPEAVTELAPDGVRMDGDHRAVLQQYVVDTAIQTSGLGAHSATLIGIDLGAASADDDVAVPPRMWVGAIASTRGAQEYFASRGIPTEVGQTTLEFRGDAVVALTSVHDVPLIRTVATVGPPTVVEAGDRIYVRATSGGVVEVAHPWIATLADGWQLTSLEFTGTTGVFERLCPGPDPVAAWGMYSPNAAFCDPGLGAVLPSGALGTTVR